MNFKPLNDDNSPPLEMDQMKVDVLCWNGHDPIRYNVMCVEAGAVNRVLNGCPLCAVLDEYTRVLEKACNNCDEDNSIRRPKGLNVAYGKCNSCGEAMFFRA